MVIAFIVTELLRENQEGGVKLPKSKRPASHSTSIFFLILHTGVLIHQ